MQRYKSKYTGPQMDVAFERALPGGEIDQMRHNRNLLDNWDFRNAINQRGATSWSGSYGIDRWTLSADNSMATFVAGTGIILNNESGNCFFMQLFEKSLSINTVYTLSVMLADGPVKSFTHIANGEYSVVDGIFFGIGFGGSSQIAFGPIEGNAITVQAAKLELGSVSTLANDPPANYDAEITKCKRYFNLWTTEAARTAALLEVGAMRTTPVLSTIDIGGVTYYTAIADL